MHWISAICPHEPAIRATERGPEWFCKPCGWAWPLFLAPRLVDDRPAGPSDA